jgi:hypothetical protein
VKLPLPSITSDQLSIYLADHYAGATFGVQLARRVQGENYGTTYGDFLARLAAEIEEDRVELETIMGKLGVDRDPLKVTVAWAGEKVGRLKLNGRLRGYAPVSRVLELEALIAGVSGKLALWRALKELAPKEPRLDEEPLDALAERARRQLAGLREHHRRAAAAALAPG